MRLFEIIFLTLTFIIFIWSLKRNSAKSVIFSIIAGCTFLTLILHLIVEGWRVQMFPAYVVGVIILAVAAKRKFINRDLATPPRSWFRLILKILVSGAGILLLIVSGFLSWARPVYKLPSPTGPYQVGTSQWYLMDKSREEIHTAQPDDYREISVFGWYPADASNMKKTAEYTKNSNLYFNQLRLVQTHSYSDAEVLKKQAPYPVLIFSHGYSSVAEQSTALMEELASHGYIVFSIGHTYYSSKVSFPDGRVISHSPRADISESLSKVRKEAKELKSGDIDSAIELFKKFNTLQEFGRSTYIWSADARFVIDWLEKLNNDEKTSPFYQKLDLERLGVMGHSFGGVTAAHVAFEDNRVKAALSFDGGVPGGEFIDHSLDVPFMFMKSESSWALLNANRLVLEHMMGSSNNDVYNITVKGSMHEDLCDSAVFSPLLKYSRPAKGIDGQKMLKIMNAYTLAFFNKHLKGIDSPLLDGPSPDFPEVIFKTRKK